MRETPSIDAENLRGAGAMLICMAAFAVNDAIMKWLLQDLPLFQAILLRGFFAMPIMVAFFLATGGWTNRTTTLPHLRNPLLWLRVLGEVGATYCFLAALAVTPLATMAAVLQVLPLTTTLAAALIFRETVGWRRYTAIAVGFAGVLLVVQPGSEGFASGAPYMVVCLAFLTLRDMTTRALPAATPSALVSLMTAVAITLMGAVGAGFEEWQPVTGFMWMLLACAAVCILFGYQFSVLCMRHGEVSFVAPFRYSVLIYTLLLGYFIFGDVPNAMAYLGSAIVVGSGLFTFYRERLSARKAATSSASIAASSRSHP